jgi:hypothetical protein
MGRGDQYGSRCCVAGFRIKQSWSLSDLLHTPYNRLVQIILSTSLAIYSKEVCLVVGCDNGTHQLGIYRGSQAVLDLLVYEVKHWSSFCPGEAVEVGVSSCH